MLIGILGPLEIVDGDRSLDVPRAKPRAVLGTLLLRPTEVVSSEGLIEAVWGQAPPASAPNTLHGYISHLRQALRRAFHPATGAPTICTRPPGYSLEVDPEVIDAVRFEQHLARARQDRDRSDNAAAATQFAQALALWRGRVLADVACEGRGQLDAGRLEELRLAAVAEYADAELALGHHGAVVGRLETAVAEHPLREGLWGQLMVALYRSGRQADALRAYQAAARALREELGIDPSPSLRRLEADILAQAPVLDPSPPMARITVSTATAPPARVPFPSLLGSAQVPYVGRQDLLDGLSRARKEAEAGVCRAVLLTGEPGIGKTRTAAEVARCAFDRGATVLYGRCDEDFGLPYQPFVEALDWYTGHATNPLLGSWCQTGRAHLAGCRRRSRRPRRSKMPRHFLHSCVLARRRRAARRSANVFNTSLLGRHPAELIRLQPLLRCRVASLAEPVSSDPRSEEYLLFEATTSWLVQLARPAPLVLVLDDLHWATKAVMLLVRHLLRSATADRQGVKMLVLGAYRDSEVDDAHPLRSLLADVRHLPGSTERPVPALSAPEVRELVSRSPGAHLGAADGGLAEVLHDETEGNPFFVEEMLRHLAESGPHLRPTGTRPFGAGREPGVPNGVRDVICRRLDRLSASARALLSLGATVGRDFEVELVAALSDLSEEGVLESLDRATDARLIEEIDADRYRFSHVLIRTTLYEALSVTRRRRTHRRVAEAIEKLRPDDVTALAHHFAEAVGPGVGSNAAVRYGLAAAEQALAARALADAEARFRGVLDLLGRAAPLDGSARVRALCGLGEAQRDQGDPAFKATLLQAGRMALQAGDMVALVRATLSNSRGVPSVIGGIDDERVALIEAALDLVGPGPSPDRARLLAQLAAEVTFAQDGHRRLALADQAEDMARGLGDEALLAEVLNRTGYAAFSPDRVERLVARGEEASRLSDATGDPAQRVLARFYWSGALLTAGRVPRFRTVTADMAAVAGDASPALQWLAQACQVRLSILDGAEIQRVTDHVLAVAQDLGEPDGAVWWTATVCMQAYCQGALPGMADVLRAGADAYPREPAWAIGYAMALAMGGRLDEARAALREAAPDPAVLVHHVFPFLSTTMCAVIAYHLDDGDLAKRTAAALAPYRHCWAHHHAGTSGPLTIPLALCAAATGHIDEAVAHSEEAERALEAAGCVHPQFRAYHAQILQQRGDRARPGAGPGSPRRQGRTQ